MLHASLTPELKMQLRFTTVCEPFAATEADWDPSASCWLLALNLHAYPSKNSVERWSRACERTAPSGLLRSPVMMPVGYEAYLTAFFFGVLGPSEASLNLSLIRAVLCRVAL